MRIVQISTRDLKGGAERIALMLHQQYRAQGYDARLLVRQQFTDALGVSHLAHPSRYAPLWPRALTSLAKRLTPWHGRVKGAWRISRALTELAEPRRTLARERGREDFCFPDTFQGIQQQSPELLHLHNLHGGFFDLRILPLLTFQVPTLITLHDMWTLTGHCAYSLGCSRWKIGCGQCPDLSLYPRVKRDATADNYRQKAEIYRASRLYIATPADWLRQAAEQSLLRYAAVSMRTIPNGVDLTIFCPGDSIMARAALDLPLESHILLFVAVNSRGNPYKDAATLEASVAHLAATYPPDGPPLLLLALGGEGASQQFRSNVMFRPLGFISAPEHVARYYQAADVYLHPANADTFPTSVLEALACGTPVIGSALQGLPEQIRSLWACGHYPASSPDHATGILVPPQDAAALAEATRALLASPALRQHLGENAARDAQHRFDQRRMVAGYLNWYHEMLHEPAQD